MCYFHISDIKLVDIANTLGQIRAFEDAVIVVRLARPYTQHEAMAFLAVWSHGSPIGEWCQNRLELHGKNAELVLAEIGLPPQESRYGKEIIIRGV